MSAASLAVAGLDGKPRAHAALLAAAARHVRQPAADGSLGAAYLDWVRLESPTRGQQALRCAAALCLAMGAQDMDTLAGLLDAVGYQPLPLRGELPLSPARPTQLSEIRARLATHPRLRLDGLDASTLELMTRGAARELWPAVAQWILPTDFVVLARPSPQHPAWVTQTCCLVVRVRDNGTVVVVGGNLLEVLRDLSKEPAVG